MSASSSCSEKLTSFAGGKNDRPKNEGRSRRDRAQENEEGKKELISLGAKFRAEGEFGYEPDVLVELWTQRAEGAKRGSHLVHKGIVLKDRSWKVNGLEFLWKDRSGYRKGDYGLVYKTFEPYFQFLSIGGEHHAISAERNSDGMFGDNNGDSAYYHKQRMRQMCLSSYVQAVKTYRRIALDRQKAPRYEMSARLRTVAEHGQKRTRFENHPVYLQALSASRSPARPLYGKRIK